MLFIFTPSASPPLGCKLLYKHDMAKRWGKHCHACAYCSNMAHRVVHNHFAGKLEEFCGDICMSQYTVLFYQVRTSLGQRAATPHTSPVFFHLQ